LNKTTVLFDKLITLYNYMVCQHGIRFTVYYHHDDYQWRSYDFVLGGGMYNLMNKRKVRGFAPHTLP